jgi:hypothetical protein
MTDPQSKSLMPEPSDNPKPAEPEASTPVLNDSKHYPGVILGDLVTEVEAIRFGGVEIRRTILETPEVSPQRSEQTRN